MSAEAETVNFVRVAACIAAGICMGFGALGPSLGQGFIAGKACESIGKRPDSLKVVFRAMIVGIVAAETSSIYAFVISLMLILLVK
ncbi:ATP synthase F0 subunit C [bacterium]|jgi:F-type H+-transporting ATPase subunit c|nr:ATP synthase F0 subunit C [bacterium]